jgi:hypothetical protein
LQKKTARKGKEQKKKENPKNTRRNEEEKRKPNTFTNSNPSICCTQAINNI